MKRVHMTRLAFMTAVFASTVAATSTVAAQQAADDPAPLVHIITRPDGATMVSGLPATPPTTPVMVWYWIFYPEVPAGSTFGAIAMRDLIDCAAGTRHTQSFQGYSMDGRFIAGRTSGLPPSPHVPVPNSAGEMVVAAVCRPQSVAHQPRFPDHHAARAAAEARWNRPRPAE